MEAAQERSSPSRREAAPASSSSSSTTSPSPRRKRQKRTRDQRDLVPTKPEPQQKEEKIDEAVNTTGKEKRNQIQQVTMDRDESPDMVDEILGRTASSRQAKTDMRMKEESCATKHIQSGNTKQKCKQENTEREEKKKVPPPPSARVDESRIDEEAVARLEEARLNRSREERVGQDEGEQGQFGYCEAESRRSTEEGAAEPTFDSLVAQRGVADRRWKHHGGSGRRQAGTGYQGRTT